MTTPPMILYVKTGYPWRHRVEAYLQKHRYCLIDVRKGNGNF